MNEWSDSIGKRTDNSKIENLFCQNQVPLMIFVYESFHSSDRNVTITSQGADAEV